MMTEKHFFDEDLIVRLEKQGYRKEVNKKRVVSYCYKDDKSGNVGILSDKKKIYVIVDKKLTNSKTHTYMVAFPNIFKPYMSLRKINTIIKEIKTNKIEDRD